MRNEFAKAGILAPHIFVVNGEFKVIMKNGLLLKIMSDADSLGDFCFIPRTRVEIVAFDGIKKLRHVTYDCATCCKREIEHDHSRKDKDCVSKICKAIIVIGIRFFHKHI